MSQGVIEAEGELASQSPKTKDVASKTPWQLARMRLRKDKLTMIAVVVSAFFVLVALVAPLLSKLGIIDADKGNQDLVDFSGVPIGGNGGISSDHWLGVVPSTGQDSLSRLMLGMSFSLGIAVTAAIISVVIGVVLGIVSGARGGWTDSIIGRLIDLTLAFPQTLMLLALASTGVVWMTKYLHIPSGTPAQFAYVVVVLGLFGWTAVARLVRGQVLSLREREFVQAARLMGASGPRIYFKEILPNLWAPILVQFTLILPAYISAEAALGYLGVSVNPPAPTLGNILNDALNLAQYVPLYFFVPAFVIAAMVVSFNLVGDGLRDALDPKSGR